ncbi:hypothetical protein [Mycolicibacterium arseniciresistens]|uniref:Uncharacterized protein n=1 Tax=Mycolicibacterium arseniciresistens TaxID=3062257 RepID=A0ABT8U9I3_9MYCO|nr:hypothetical protein [Mycolicibacterium arseniciresistens]MDO3634442.1 hypothetical protein [Mycolicibacterium arseniciresistens]
MVWKTHFIAAAAFRRRIMDLELDEEDRERTAASARRLADQFKRRHPEFSYEWFYGACGLDHWGELPPEYPNSHGPMKADGD